MSPVANKQYCVGSPAFDPSAVAGDVSMQKEVDEFLQKDDLHSAIHSLFKLPENDDYVYHATASVKLSEVQRIVQLGGINGLHAWYKAEDGEPVSARLAACRQWYALLT